MNALAKRWHVVAALAALAGGAAYAETEPPAEELLRQAGVEAGLLVHVGTTDGTLEIAWAQQNRFVVHGLAADERTCRAARQAILASGLYGLATVDVLRDGELPYPENMVNLLIVDTGPSTSEIVSVQETLRVLVPGGVALVKTSDTWRKTIKPWPTDMDDWTHWNHGPDGNAVSKDTLVKPANSLKWLVGRQGQDIRVAGGMLLSPLRKRVDWRREETGELTARDAFNGVPRWRCPTGVYSGDRPTQWAAGRRSVFHFPTHAPSFAVATDIRTGQTERTFDQGLQRPLPDELGSNKGAGVPVLLVCDRTLVQSYGRRVVALDIDTGSVRWRHEAPSEIAQMVASPDASQVFLQEVSDWQRGRARWGKHTTVALTCLEDGRPAWRSRELEGQEIADLIYHERALYAFDPCTNLGDDGDANIWRLDAQSGEILWASEPMKGEYNRSLNNMVVRGDRVLSWGPFNNLRSYDVQSGAESLHLINDYNQRCTRLSATTNYLIFGFSSWVDRQFTWTQTSVGRSDCAFPAFPAHGQTFFTYNLACSCINPLRGIVAMTHEPLTVPVDDRRRLETLDPTPQPAVVPADPRSAPITGGMIADEWSPDTLLFYFLDGKTEPASYKGLTLVADVHRHTLVASRDGRAVWTFTAGGRIYNAPLIHDGRCYVASADGYVYCLDAATGAARWRFLAAPRVRNIMVYAQLENTWPVYNAVLHDGLVCVAAGRHAELDGGIRLWGLDPQTGRPQWSSTLHTAPTVLPAGEKSPRGARPFLREVASRQPLNGGLMVDGGSLRFRAPYLTKFGSSNSKVGYFKSPREEGGEPSFFAIEIDPAAFNGRVIDPQELVVLEQKKR